MLKKQSIQQDNLLSRLCNKDSACSATSNFYLHLLCELNFQVHEHRRSEYVNHTWREDDKPIGFLRARRPDR